MSYVVVFEDAQYTNLLPLVYWRAVFQLRCGRVSLLEKIRQQLGPRPPVLIVRPELADVVREQTTLEVNPDLTDIDDDLLMVNGRWLADRPLPDVPLGSRLTKDDTIVAARIGAEVARRFSPRDLLREDLTDVLPADARAIQADDNIKIVRFPWDLVRHNGPELIRECGDSAKASAVGPGVHLIAPEHIHLGSSVRIKPGAVIDAEDGPVWIDDEVSIEPNAVIQGPCCIGANSLVQPAALVRENTSIGTVCKVGGEIEESIMHAYCNKQHHGFLGHSYVAEWVNIGAGSTSSDLKNTYGEVKVTLSGRDEIETGLRLVGLNIADHSKAGINVCFPTGAVVGTSSSVAVSRNPPKFVPSFRWLTDESQTDYDPHQAIKVAQRAMARRNRTLTEAEKQLFFALPEITAHHERR